MAEANFNAQREEAISNYCSYRNLTRESVISEEPTKYLCLLNLGFGGEQGVSLTIIQGIVGGILGATRIVANNDWPYIYIVFDHVELTNNAKEELNMNSFSELDGRTLFAEYVQHHENAY